MNVYLIVFWKVNVINCCKEVDLQLRRCNKMKPIFVFNINTVDNPESAKEGARLALHLAEMVFFLFLFEI